MTPSERAKLPDVPRIRKVVEDCERMLRFAPPPSHLAESNEWHLAIRNAQDLLQELPVPASPAPVAAQEGENYKAAWEDLESQLRAVVAANRTIAAPGFHVSGAMQAQEGLLHVMHEMIAVRVTSPVAESGERPKWKIRASPLAEAASAYVEQLKTGSMAWDEMNALIVEASKLSNAYMQELVARERAARKADRESAAAAESGGGE